MHSVCCARRLQGVVPYSTHVDRGVRCLAAVMVDRSTQEQSTSLTLTGQLRDHFQLLRPQELMLSSVLAFGIKIRGTVRHHTVHSQLIRPNRLAGCPLTPSRTYHRLQAARSSRCALSVCPFIEGVVDGQDRSKLVSIAGEGRCDPKSSKLLLLFDCSTSVESH